LIKDREKISSKDSKIDEGEDVFLTCESYLPAKWTFNEKKLPDNTVVLSDTTLVINGFSSKNEGSYECMGHTVEGYLFIAPTVLKFIS